MTTALSQAPVLSTPESHIFEDPTPISIDQSTSRYTDTELWEIYEISRTAREIRGGGYRRIALQFPDGMLRDAPRIFEKLEKELEILPTEWPKEKETGDDLVTSFNDISIYGANRDAEIVNGGKLQKQVRESRVRLYILADTSYGSCCVDEVAAEHVDADVVVHYGRSCLSQTARLPVIYVFTAHPLVLEDVVQALEEVFPIKSTKVVLMADITYHNHVSSLKGELESKGYSNLLTPEIVHDPSSPIPNRKVEGDLQLHDYALFHLSDPPPALLHTLSSRVKEMYIYPTTTQLSSNPKALLANSNLTLRRRYALLTSLSTCAIFGILINTLSVKNYLQTVTSIQSLISRSGKKSYTFVVGKVNAAKIANFSEIGGWVVVGCWESSLIESKEFYRPIITPFELGLALQSDGERIWDGSWRGDFNGIDKVASGPQTEKTSVDEENGHATSVDPNVDKHKNDDEDTESESEPPEFDLRTGRYVSNSRPMRTKASQAQPFSTNSASPSDGASTVLTRRAQGDLTTINGAVSPGAEYLRSQRTWTGLGSDFHENEASATIEEGRRGVARGYVVGDDKEKR